MVRKRVMHVFKILERLPFSAVFLWLVSLILLFGLAYGYLNYFSGAMLNTHPVTLEENLLDGLYLSGVTATTIGYGDIVPIGYARILVVIEGLFGLFLYGVVVAKLVSRKQEFLLDEVYSITFHTMLTQLRASLHTFRVDAGRMIGLLETNTFPKIEREDWWIIVTSFNNTLRDFLQMTTKHATPVFDGVQPRVTNDDLDLVLGRINLALRRLVLLIELAKAKKLPFTREVQRSIRTCTSLLENISMLFSSRQGVAQLASRRMRLLALRLRKLVPDVKIF